MLPRFNPRRLVRGHLKSLTSRTSKRQFPDRPARVILFGLPLVLASASYWRNFHLADPQNLLAGLALLLGGLLSVFAQVASWRGELHSREGNRRRSEASDREQLDETATHILMAAIVTVAAIVVIVVAQGLTSEKDGSVTGVLGSFIVALGTYLGLLFVVVILRLYDFYLYVYNVSPRIHGGITTTPPEGDDESE